MDNFKEFSFEEMLKVVAKLHKDGNKFVEQKEWKLAANR
jgi:methionyl-tRNA synthetase